MTKPLEISFVTSADNYRTLPPSPVEVAFVGRSNVGKSSLINALANRKQLARVSKTPGRTQLINLFVTPGTGTIVDLPGYGYAAVPGKIKRGWEKMIVGYLQEREELEMIFVLVDGLIGPTDLDLMMLEQLRDSNVEFKVVATKQDKVKPSKSATRRAELALACGVAKEEIIWASASTGLGIDQLRTVVNQCLNTNPNRR